MARASPYLPKELLKLIYTALFRSHMEYCSVISSAAKTHLKKLMSYREKLHTSYIEYHVMPMLIYYCCFSNWKILMTDEKPILSSLLNHLSQENVTQQCLRLLTYVTDKTLTTCQSRATLGSRRPSVFGATLYNQHLGFSTDTELSLIHI